MFQLLVDPISLGLGIINVSRYPERSNQDLSSEPKAGDNVTVAERAWLFSGVNGVWPTAVERLPGAGRWVTLTFLTHVSFHFVFLKY